MKLLRELDDRKVYQLGDYIIHHFNNGRAVLWTRRSTSPHGDPVGRVAQGFDSMEELKAALDRLRSEENEQP